MQFSDDLTAADAAVFETFVVPRYLSLFGELALEMLLAGPSGRVAHLGCRTGYPDRGLLESFADASVFAVDGSPAALDVARAAAMAAGDLPIEYHQGERLPLTMDAEQYSHVLVLHPLVNEEDRMELLHESHRLLYSGGQLLFAVPLRGSFQELGDLLKEYALKQDRDEFADRVERMMNRRPTIERLADVLESVGFIDVDVEFRHTALRFASGRAFVDDPVTRLMLIPDLKAELAADELDEPIEYLRDAIDRYWSEHEFELTLNVGCASARRA